MVSVRAIYENGVFRPLGPIELPEGARVEVIVVEQPEIGATDSIIAQGTTGPEGMGTGTASNKPLVGKQLAAALDQIASLPYAPHPDGRTDIGVHHDDILYPKDGKIT